MVPREEDHGGIHRAPARRGLVKSGGFPCRFGGCDEVFTVPQRDSMPALLAASGHRTNHEVAAHDYHHPVYVEEKRRSWAMQATKPKGTH